MTADLVVVGAGVMGAWTALRAQRAGRSTTLIDAWGAGHPRATSGDETRIIRSSHGADAYYSRWAREALEDWIAFGEETGEPIFVQAGCLWFAHRETGFEAASRLTLAMLGVPVERLAAKEVAERWPHVSVDDVAFAIFEPEAGLLLARRAVAALVRSFSADGGRFQLGSVRPGRVAGSRLESILAADGTEVEGDTFVFACGPWLPRLFPTVMAPLIRVTKQDVFFVGTAGGDARFGPELTPCWVDYDASFYGIPSIDGRGFKIAPDRYGPVFDPSAGERIVDPDGVRLTRSYVRRRFPALADQPIIETRVCQYETTPDTHFIIDRHPELENVWLAGGGSGHGFKHGPRIAAHLLSRIDGVAPSEEERRFGIERPRLAGIGMRTSGDAIVTTWEGY